MSKWIPYEQVLLNQEWEQAALHQMAPTLFSFPTRFYYKINDMQIVVMSRHMFERYMKDKQITPDNVEKLKDVFIISIQNDAEDNLDDTYKPTFTESKSNVHVVKFSDVSKDIQVKMIGSTETVTAKAMTAEQAQAMYSFIKEHKTKKVCLIHCTAGVSRSGAVGAFVAEVMGVNYLDFKAANPSILPNERVLRLLRNARLNDGVVENPPGWVDFWLEANQYFSIVRYGDLPVLRESYPELTHLLLNAKLNLAQDDFDSIPTFGLGVEYTGMTLGRWLSERNMLQYFNN